MPPIRVASTSHRGGRPCSARTIAGTVVISSRTMMRGFVSATKAFTVSGNGRRVARRVRSVGVGRADGVGRRLSARRHRQRHHRGPHERRHRHVRGARPRRELGQDVRAADQDLADEQRQRERRQPYEPVGPRHHRSRPDEAPDHECRDHDRQDPVREHLAGAVRGEVGQQAPTHQGPVPERQAGALRPDVRADEEEAVGGRRRPGGDAGVAADPAGFGRFREDRDRHRQRRARRTRRRSAA